MSYGTSCLTSSLCTQLCQINIRRTINISGIHEIRTYSYSYIRRYFQTDNKLPKEFVGINRICEEEYIKMRNRKFVDKGVRFAVITSVTIENAAYWDVTQFESSKNRRFGGTQRYVPPKHRFLKEPHGVTS
jgi:hypothetical protein